MSNEPIIAKLFRSALESAAGGQDSKPKARVVILDEKHNLVISNHGCLSVPEEVFSLGAYLDFPLMAELKNPTDAESLAPDIKFTSKDKINFPLTTGSATRKFLLEPTAVLAVLTEDKFLKDVPHKAKTEIWVINVDAGKAKLTATVPVPDSVDLSALAGQVLTLPHSVRAYIATSEVIGIEAYLGCIASKGAAFLIVSSINTDSAAYMHLVPQEFDFDIAMPDGSAVKLDAAVAVGNGGVIYQGLATNLPPMPLSAEIPPCEEPKKKRRSRKQKSTELEEATVATTPVPQVEETPSVSEKPKSSNESLEEANTASTMDTPEPSSTTPLFPDFKPETQKEKAMTEVKRRRRRTNTTTQQPTLSPGALRRQRHQEEGEIYAIIDRLREEASGPAGFIADFLEERIDEVLDRKLGQ